MDCLRLASFYGLSLADLILVLCWFHFGHGLSQIGLKLGHGLS